MLPRKKLVPLKSEFNRIRASAKRYDSPSFGLLIAYKQSLRSSSASGRTAGLGKQSTAETDSKVAFIVSKKIDKRSVVRHQVKRKLSDAVSSFLPRLGKNVELVFLAKQFATGVEKEQLKLEMEQVFKRARLL